MFERLFPTFTPIALLVFGILGLAAGAGAENCTCNIQVYSTYRWMDPWWGLECNEHCGHGYVGSSCDSLHGAGCGAMTGYVRLRYSNGATISTRNCPDDHETCFRGPSACDDGGSWGNVCSADIWDCKSGGKAGGSWECDGLSDSGWVFQTSRSGVTLAGACGTNWFNVLEFIDENDPFCCDDPMGYINVSAFTAEGTRTVFLAGEDENCNGGSQGGVPPHCGRFGATLAVVTTCASGTGGGGGEEDDPPPPLIESERQALAESVERRQRRIAELSMERVNAEVAERARGLGVKAPAPELTETLVDVGLAELDRDECRLTRWEGAEGACRVFERRLDRLAAAFKKLSGGLTPEEFRSGSALHGPPPDPAAPQP